MDKDFNAAFSSQNAPNVSREEAKTAFKNGRIALSKDLTLKAKSIRGGEVIWMEDSSLIHRINDHLAEINATLAEEKDLICAENQLKEQRSKIEEQTSLYQSVFNIARPYREKIEKSFLKAKTNKEKDDALRLVLVYGTFLKRRSNLLILKNEKNIPLSELVYSLKESISALSFYGVHCSIFTNGDGQFEAEQIEFVYDFFEDCIECALPELSACLVRLSLNDDELFCRIVLDNAKNAIKENWRKEEREKYGARLSITKSEGALYATLVMKSKGSNV